MSDLLTLNTRWGSLVRGFAELQTPPLVHRIRGIRDKFLLPLGDFEKIVQGRWPEIEYFFATGKNQVDGLRGVLDRCDGGPLKAFFEGEVGAISSAYVGASDVYGSYRLVQGPSNRSPLLGTIHTRLLREFQSCLGALGIQWGVRTFEARLACSREASEFSRVSRYRAAIGGRIVRGSARIAATVGLGVVALFLASTWGDRI